MTDSFDLAGTKVLIVDDIAENRLLLRQTLSPEGIDLQLASNGETAISVALRTHPDLIFLDVMMPGLDGYETCRRLKSTPETRDIPIIFITAHNEVDAIVKGFRVGAVDYIAKPFRTEEVLARARTQLQLSRLTRSLQERNEQLELEIAGRKQAETERDQVHARLDTLAQQEAARWGVSGMIGQSGPFHDVIGKIRKVAGFGASRVLITGESGTGKELIARAIHAGGPRSAGPFVPVNCSAITAELAESLFFGHVKGSFTGAVDDRRGFFELADGGTLFLDEVGDMPMALQAKLLRVLEDGEVHPLGAAAPIKVDTNIVAASNIDFESRIQSGDFRQDLYFRLARFTFQAPPLRERSDDIELLAHHFVRLFAQEIKVPPPLLSDQAKEALLAYDFPGNVRELKNILERAVMESEGELIQPEHLHFFGPSPGEGTRTPAVSSSPATMETALSEEEQIVRYIESYGPISNAHCRTLLKTDRNHATYVLRKLVDAGRLSCQGQGRWARYRLPE
jgi:DNA-binding NtrC family response regulator